MLLLLAHHLLASFVTASLVTMFMLARPLLPFRRLAHRLTKWDGESWGTCGYCASLPFSILTVLLFDLRLDTLVVPCCSSWGLGAFLSLVFVHLAASFVHFCYMRLTNRPIEYPPLEGSDQ